jgi:bifunctional DNase/RNase
MGKMIECQIDSVRVSLTNQDRIIVLKDKERERYLPVWIGIFEAESITIALQNIAIARPLTHDLFLKLMEQLGAKLLRVEINSLVSGTYFANLVVETDKTLYIDCRPSDALALVVRSGVPIFVDEDVLEEVAIRPEDFLDESLPLSPDEEMDESEDPGDTSLFDDFLNNMPDKPEKDSDL